MNQYIRFNNKQYNRLIFKISAYAEFSSILKQLTQTSFINCSFDHEHVVYAVLELLNNSIRAHREKKETRKILLVFLLDYDNLHIIVSDWGGGFNKKELPYCIESDPESINPHDETFELYREKYGYLRFGMGLLLAKKTFSHFSISFKDEWGNLTDWSPGKTAGTIINISINTGNSNEHE